MKKNSIYSFVLLLCFVLLTLAQNENQGILPCKALDPYVLRQFDLKFITIDQVNNNNVIENASVSIYAEIVRFVEVSANPCEGKLETEQIDFFERQTGADGSCILKVSLFFNDNNDHLIFYAISNKEGYTKGAKSFIFKYHSENNDIILPMTPNNLL